MSSNFRLRLLLSRMLDCDDDFFGMSFHFRLPFLLRIQLTCAFLDIWYQSGCCI